MNESKVAKARAALIKMQRELSDIIETLAGDGTEVEVKHTDLYPQIAAELEKRGSMKDYEIIEQFMPFAKSGRTGPESTVWQTIEQGIRHGKFVVDDREFAPRTAKMKSRKKTPELKHRYYGYVIKLPQTQK